MSPLIYIAGPYTNPDPVENTHKAVKVGLKVFEETGCGVIIPHVTLLAHAIEPHGIDYWYLFDIKQLQHCHALYRMDGPSTGADGEVAFAEEHGIPVFHYLSDLYKWVEAGREP